MSGGRGEKGGCLHPRDGQEPLLGGASGLHRLRPGLRDCGLELSPGAHTPHQQPPGGELKWRSQIRKAKPAPVKTEDASDLRVKEAVRQSDYGTLKTETQTLVSMSNSVCNLSKEEFS